MDSFSAERPDETPSFAVPGFVGDRLGIAAVDSDAGVDAVAKTAAAHMLVVVAAEPTDSSGVEDSVEVELSELEPPSGSCWYFPTDYNFYVPSLLPYFCTSVCTESCCSEARFAACPPTGVHLSCSSSVSLPTSWTHHIA